MDGGAWWATVHGVAKSRTRLRDFTFTFYDPDIPPEHIFQKDNTQHYLQSPRHVSNLNVHCQRNKEVVHVYNRVLFSHKKE